MTYKCWLHTQTDSQSVVWQSLQVWKLQYFWLAIFLFRVSFSSLHNLRLTSQLSCSVSNLWHLMAWSAEYQAEKPHLKTCGHRPQFMNDRYVSYTIPCDCDCVCLVRALMSLQLCHTQMLTSLLYIYKYTMIF